MTDEKYLLLDRVDSHRMSNSFLLDCVVSNSPHLSTYNCQSWLADAFVVHDDIGIAKGFNDLRYHFNV